jgi:CRP-like cAMP-binding protein
MPISELTLRNCSFFKQAPPACLTQAAAGMDIVYLKKREVLLVHGRPFQGLGVVLQGRLQAMDFTVDGREVALSAAEQDEAFGVAHLMAARPIELTWVAMTPCTIAVLPRQAALDLFQNAMMGLQAASSLAQQVCDFWSWQKILSVHPVSARVCAWIVWAAADRSSLEIPRHAELAWRLGTSRESITRTLQKLQSDGIMRRDADLWLIENPIVLRQLAQGDARDND